MPAQLPQEATTYFGSLLRPYAHDMVSYLLGDMASGSLGDTW